MNGSSSIELVDAGLCPKSAVTQAIETLSVSKVLGESLVVGNSKLICKIPWTSEFAGVVVKIIQTFTFLKLQFWLTQNCLQIWKFAKWFNPKRAKII